MTPEQGVALQAALQYIDDQAGILNGVPNNPLVATPDAVDDIAGNLAKAFRVSFDEYWPTTVLAVLLKTASQASR